MLSSELILTSEAITYSLSVLVSLRGALTRFHDSFTRCNVLPVKPRMNLRISNSATASSDFGCMKLYSDFPQCLQCAVPEFLAPSLSERQAPKHGRSHDQGVCVCFDLPVDGITINIVTRTHFIDGGNFTFGLNVFSVPNPIYDPSLNGLSPLPRKSHVVAASFSRLCIVSLYEADIVGFHGSGKFCNFTSCICVGECLSLHLLHVRCFPQ